MPLQKIPLQSDHIPIMLSEVADLLDLQSKKKYVDATLGMAGHASHFLHNFPHLCCIGFDQDSNAREKASAQLSQFPSERWEIIPKNFSEIGTIEHFQPDSILFDIGVSSLQFDTPERGFSFRFSAPLDMRMDQSSTLTAREILNTRSAEELQEIFSKYGEEPQSKTIAQKIVDQRMKEEIETTTQLSELIREVKKNFSKKRKKNAGGQPESLVFQALRIAVNNEFFVLEKALHNALKILKNKGRIAVISFHSLEDAIVKKVFSEYENQEKKQKYPQKDMQIPEDIKRRGFYIEKITKKPISPNKEELSQNPRSRSAKLRVIEKICI